MNKTANLGKGLGELLGNSFSDLTNDRTIIDVEISQIEPGKYQPRVNISEDELENLTASIREKGVIQPILVKLNDHKKYEIIAGERRYRASLKADKLSVPCIVLDIDDKDAYELALIENIQREQLNPIEEAIAIDKLIGKYSYTQDTIAQQLGKSRAHIANVLRLLSLPQEIQDMISNKELTMGHARALVKKENAIELAKEIIDNNLSVREVEQIVKASATKQKKKLIAQHDKQKKIYLKQISDKLRDAINHKVKIKHSGRKGQIIIEYNGPDDLNNLINLLATNVSRET